MRANESYHCWPVCFVVTLYSFISTTSCLELPNFENLRRVYPGDILHGGKYTRADVEALVTGRLGHSHTRHPQRHGSVGGIDSTTLRLSYALNALGGAHGLGVTPIHRSDLPTADSLTGQDGLQYLFRPIAVGPYLASKYGNPVISYRPEHRAPASAIRIFYGHQGIMRLVTYNSRTQYASGHVGLWDCDHFHQLAEWSLDRHIISAEFWETPDSYCENVPKMLDEDQLSSPVLIKSPKSYKPLKVAGETSKTSARGPQDPVTEEVRIAKWSKSCKNGQETKSKTGAKWESVNGGKQRFSSSQTNRSDKQTASTRKRPVTESVLKRVRLPKMNFRTLRVEGQFPVIL